MQRLHPRLRKAAVFAAAIVALLAAWYLLAYLLRSSGDVLAAAKLPYPHEIIQQIIETPDAFANATWTTLSQSVIGLAIGTFVAVVLSTLMVQARWAEASIMPYLLLSQMVPIIVLIPILQSIFQNDTATRLSVATLFAIFTVTIAMVRGLKSTPAPAFELMRSYAAGRVSMTRYVQLPVSLPMFFTGLRLAAPLCIVGTVLVDLTGSQAGLGFVMLTGLTYGPSYYPILWAGALIVLLLGVTLAQSVVLAERILAPWIPGADGRS